MEHFNSKLFEKYTDLKKRKFSEIEESNQKLLSDFLKYQSAMEQLVEDLKNENDRLRVKIVSNEEQNQEFQRLLLDEKQQLKRLSSEVGTLHELLHQKNDNIERSLKNTACISPAIQLEDSSDFLQEKQKLDTLTEHNAITSEKDTTFTLNECYNQSRLSPICCNKAKGDSGDGNGKKCNPCAFHSLLELLIGMNFSVDYQIEGPRFSVTHKMSGYNFTLSWVRDKDGGKFAYRVSSLGNIKSIALDWMKEDIVFSLAMCPIFFDRLSKVVGD